MRKYVWQHAADWDRDGWNGVSYTGREDAMIRMRFTPRLCRLGKRQNRAWAGKLVVGAVVRHKRGLKRRAALLMARRATAINRGTAGGNAR